MSRIFEGLRRASGEDSNPIIERILGTGGGSAPADPAAGRLDGGRGPNGPAGAAPGGSAAGPYSSKHAPKEPEAPFPSAAHAWRVASAHLAAGPLAVVAGANPRASEQYRIIRTKVVQHPRQPRRIVISSAGSGDGKTVTSGNLAWTLALRTGASVLLVDADFRHSSIAALYGVPGEPGLADVLAGASKLEDAIVRIEQVPSLCVLPGGTARFNPAELLDSPRWQAVTDQFAEWFRYTIFDAPPAGAVADYDLIQAVCDGVILVVRPDFSGRHACLQAIEGTPKERLLGVVLNHVQDWFLWKSPNAYYYYSGKPR